MLNLNTIIKICEMDCGAEVNASLDRHDNTDHRSSYANSAIQPYESQLRPGDIEVNLRYSDGSDGDVRIVQM